jgi:hypothetical protein
MPRRSFTGETLGDITGKYVFRIISYAFYALYVKKAQKSVKYYYLQSLLSVDFASYVQLFETTFTPVS